MFDGMGCSSSQQQQYAAFKNSPPLTKEQFEQQVAAAVAEKTTRVEAHNASKFEATKISQQLANGTAKVESNPEVIA